MQLPASHMNPCLSVHLLCFFFVDLVFLAAFLCVCSFCFVSKTICTTHASHRPINWSRCTESTQCTMIMRVCVCVTFRIASIHSIVFIWMNWDLQQNSCSRRSSRIREFHRRRIHSAQCPIDIIETGTIHTHTSVFVHSAHTKERWMNKIKSKTQMCRAEKQTKTVRERQGTTMRRMSQRTK